MNDVEFQTCVRRKIRLLLYFKILKEKMAFESSSTHDLLFYYIAYRKAFVHVYQVIIMKKKIYHIKEEISMHDFLTQIFFQSTPTTFGPILDLANSTFAKFDLISLCCVIPGSTDQLLNTKSSQWFISESDRFLCVWRGHLLYHSSTATTQTNQHAYNG